jgi:hypothetical protein
MRVWFKVHGMRVWFKVHGMRVGFKVDGMRVGFKVHGMRVGFKVHCMRVCLQIHKSHEYICGSRPYNIRIHFRAWDAELLSNGSQNGAYESSS